MLTAQSDNVTNSSCSWKRKINKAREKRGNNDNVLKHLKHYVFNAKYIIPYYYYAK